MSTSKNEQGILKDGDVSGLLSFGSKRGLARIDHGTRSYFYFCTVGFEHVERAYNLSETEVDAGLLTVILSETKPIPIVPPIRIRNIVEYSDKDADAEYAGHDAELIRSLFPLIRAFYADDVSKDKDETWRVFFLLCISEGAVRGSLRWPLKLSKRKISSTSAMPASD